MLSSLKVAQAIHNHNCKIVTCYEMSQRALDLDRFFSMIKQQKERKNVDVGVILKWIIKT
jgi:hypothetical protein